MGEDSGSTRSAEVTELLASYDEMFKKRYTLDDEVFKKYLDTPSPDPPVVENWYSRPRRSFDSGRDGRGRRGGWDNRRDDRNRGYHDRRGGGGGAYGHHRDRDNRQGGNRQGGWRDHRRDDRHHPYQHQERSHGHDRRQERGSDRRHQRDNERGTRNWEDY